MFGTLRTILAIMVLVGHLTDQWQIGTYAVFAFYIISGYLMTLIMHESYGYNLVGRKNFAINRFLRLYPGYWVILFLSVILVILIGDFSNQYNKLIYLPNSISEWLSVLSMLYIAEFPNKVEPNLAPTTWAITVELFFYALICLGLSKTKFRVIVWLAFSFAYVIYGQVAELSWPYKYFPIPAASLPFAIGAFIYFRKKEGFISLSDSWITNPLTLTILLVSNAVLTLIFPSYFQTGFYVSLFISILICYEIAMGRKWPVISFNLDKAIGDYSYPIYLMHWQVGILVTYFITNRVVKNESPLGYMLSFLTLIICLAISALLIKFIDKPIQNHKAKKLLNNQAN